MNHIYLSRMKLRGFRSYASETEIVLPTGPGLTVIVGPNGLGKSTLFDAIEWGLTGDLRRVTGLDAKAADKRAALGQDPNVQLWFSDQAHVSRTLASATIENTAATSIAEWLTADAWRGVSSVADCLKFTHFLGQAASQMFVNLDSKARWGLLEGPAGLQSLWKVELALGRKQTQSAFDRVEQELANTAAQSLENRVLVERLQTDLRTTRELARAQDAIASEEILERCMRISDELAAHAGSTVDPLSPTDKPQELETRLQRQKLELEAAARHLAGQRMQLSLWVSLAEQYDVALAKLADLVPKRADAETTLIADENEAFELETRAKNQEAELQVCVERRSHIQEQRDVIVAERERLRQIDVLNERRQALESSTETLLAQADEQARSIATRQENLAALQNLRATHAEALQRNNTLAALTVRAETLLNQDRMRQKARDELMLLPQTEELMRAEIIALREATAALEAEAGALRSRKEAAAATSGAIAAGVAQIAAALRAEDCVCPVCSSTFAVTGMLKELAELQAQESNQQLANLEAEILWHDVAIPTTQQHINTASSRLEYLQENRKALGAIIMATDQLESTLRGAALFAGLPLSEFLPSLAIATAQADAEARSLELAMTSSPDEGAVRAEIERLTTQQRETEISQDKCAAALAASSDDLSLLLSWPYSEKTADELAADAGEMDLAFVEAQQAVLFAQTNCVVARTIAAHFRDRVASGRLCLTQLDYQRDMLNSAVNDLVSRWKELNYENSPSSEAVRHLDAEYQRRQLSLQRLVMDHEEVVQGRQHYLMHSEIQRLESELATHLSRHQVATVDALLESLNRDYIAATKHQERLASVQKKRVELLASFKEKATNIRSTVSTPLNVNIEKFCAALLSERTHQVSLNPVASATSAQAQLSFRLEDEPQTEKNPLLYMSEGQLAAVNLCLLFGAAATYPWSRWKGLLLDDPLHHNDSIHAAAFIDVARNLIRYQGYQIIVSTHDADQAGYFLRKCSNAGIAARYLHLYARAEDGTALIQSA